MLKIGTLLFILSMARLVAADFATLVREAEAAEAQLDCVRALELFQQADALQPGNAYVLQKIARQYSDLVSDQPTREEQKRYAEQALAFSQQAVKLEPDNAVNVLSVAVCYGKLGLLSDTRTKVAHSRLVKEYAERALQLDPRYAWAHHLLGRWHYEVAGLGFTSRFFVQLIYGGLPDADRGEAIRHLKLATNLEPAELNHWLELGFAYAANEQFAEARQAWEKGLAMPMRAKPDIAAQARASAALARLK